MRRRRIEVFAMNDEHRHPGAVLGFRPEPSDYDGVGIDGHVGASPDSSEFAGRHVAAIDGARLVVRGVGEKGVRRVGIGRDAGAAESREIDRAELSAGHVAAIDAADRILLVLDDQRAAGIGGALEHGGSFLVSQQLPLVG